MSTPQQTPTGATLDVDRSDPAYRAWLKEAVRRVQADANRSADTHLLLFPLPERWGIDLYLKDESTHPPPAASSTGWPARCSCTACATAGSVRTAR